MRLRINKQLAIFAIMIILLCEPVWFSFTAMDYLFKVGKVIVFLYVLYDFFFVQKSATRSKTFYCLVVFELLLIVSTTVNWLNPYYWILYGMTNVSVFYITEKYIQKYGKDALMVIIKIYLIFLTLNALSMVFDAGHRLDGTVYYFLGIRTRITDSFYVLLLAMILLDDIKQKRKLVFAELTLMIVSLVLFNVSTMYVGLGIFGCLAAVYKVKYFKRLVASRYFLFIVVMGIVGVVFFRIQQYFSGLFELFGKDTDISYRTYIWDSAISVILESPLSIILGHGVTELGEFATFAGRKWQAHNQFLQILLDGGILGLASFAACISTSIHKCIKQREKKTAYLCVAFLISYIAMMITEIYSYYPQFYLILSLLANYEFTKTKRLVG